MAIIGEMRNLTIGGKTYTIPGYTLPIASASTLGGVRIGSGLAIESGTGILSVTNATVTETDPVFSASAAAGITSADISNWNGKVSDTGLWNGVTLNKLEWNATTDTYVAQTQLTSSTDAYYIKATSTPTPYTIAKYNGSSYLKSTTPSANDNSTKVATTAYVDRVTPIATYDTAGLVKPWYSTTGTASVPTAALFNTNITINTRSTTSNRYYAIESDKDGRLFVNVPWTNINTDYLTLATLPIYDGTVV